MRIWIYRVAVKVLLFNNIIIIQIYLLIKKVQEQTNKNELYIYINDMYILIFWF